MDLTAQQLADFDQQGYLFFPGHFTLEEAAVLKRASEEVYALQREEVWRETSGAARTAFAAHVYNETFGRLGRHPRLVQPVMQLVDGPVYMHQFKVNAKAAFDGDVWQWHQDFGTWHRDDGMPEPRAMNIAVFVDEVTAANGPLLFIPGSHKHGVLEAGHDVETTWRNILGGRSRVSLIESFDTAGFASRIGSTVRDLDMSPYMSVKEMRKKIGRAHV